MPRGCRRHPTAAVHGRHCAACLIERALTSAASDCAPEDAPYTIRVPLGESRDASVFVVEDARRLLRLKQWRRTAPPDFLERFKDLKERLDAWRQPSILAPMAAYVDASGCPSVVTEFRQGLPLLECVSRGRVAVEQAAVLIQKLVEVTTAAHARGLAHGSVVGSNVFLDADGSPYLLDSGMAVILSLRAAPADWVVGDLEGFDRIREAARQQPRNR